jgi:hypothetical protein
MRGRFGSCQWHVAPGLGSVGRISDMVGHEDERNGGSVLIWLLFLNSHVVACGRNLSARASVSRSNWLASIFPNSGPSGGSSLNAPPSTLLLSVWRPFGCFEIFRTILLICVSSYAEVRSTSSSSDHTRSVTFLLYRHIRKWPLFPAAPFSGTTSSSSYCLPPWVCFVELATCLAARIVWHRFGAAAGPTLFPLPLSQAQSRAPPPFWSKELLGWRFLNWPATTFF